MNADALDVLLPASGGPNASSPTTVTYGKVTATDPVAVQFNGTAPGSAVSGILAVDDFTPEVGDVVILIRVGPAWVILGTVATTPSGGGTPIGAIFPYAAATAPSRYLLCDGAAVSRTTYEGLFAVIGTYYGAGDGSTTFNIPDLRSRTVVGTGDGGANLTNRTLGSKFGAETHTLTQSEMPVHTHGQNPHSHAPSGGGAFAKNVYPATTSWTFQAGSGNLEANGGTTTASATATNKNAGGGAAHNNVQPSIALSYIIRAS